ncbi:MAG: hypothetical protein WB036_06005, partial [Pseudolabrys sp.]
VWPRQRHRRSPVRQCHRYSDCPTALRPGSHAVAWGGRPFHGHGRFVHRHHRVFFVGGGPWWVGGYDSCWQWVPTPWGPRRVWTCDYF